MTADATHPFARRPTELCRSWLFVPGAEATAHAAALTSGADVVLLEFEDFTPPEQRPAARAAIAGFFAAARAGGQVVGARLNCLESADGPLDLEAVMAAGPDIVALPKVVAASQIKALAAAVEAREAPERRGRTELLPNVESARGLRNTAAIADVSRRVTACLVASEDMAADLGAERGRDALELTYVRQAFLVDCVASGVLAVDCPYTWSDDEGARNDTAYARRLGYRAKSAVTASHAAVINGELTPSSEATAKARGLVAAFEAARARGEARAEVDGSLVEWPIYLNAQRLVARAEALGAAAPG